MNELERRGSVHGPGGQARDRIYTVRYLTTSLHMGTLFRNTYFLYQIEYSSIIMEFSPFIRSLPYVVRRSHHLI